MNSNDDGDGELFILSVDGCEIVSTDAQTKPSTEAPPDRRIVAELNRRMQDNGNGSEHRHSDDPDPEFLAAFYHAAQASLARGSFERVKRAAEKLVQEQGENYWSESRY